MRIVELVLLEAKDEYVVKAFGPKIAAVAKLKASSDEVRDKKVLELVRKTLVPLDPTSNQKYLVWIASLYANGNLDPEDFYKVPEELTLFTKVQQKLPVKDIMQYKTLPDLSDALNPFRDEDAQKSGKEAARSERDQLFDRGEAVLTMKTANYTVVEPRSVKAACELGKGTRWCTSAKNHNAFSSYYNRDVLYIIYSKLPGGPHQLAVSRASSNTKYRHYSEPYLADSSDRHTELSIIRHHFPEFADYLIKKHSYLGGSALGKNTVVDYVLGFYSGDYKPDLLLKLRPIENITKFFNQLSEKDVLSMIEKSLRWKHDTLNRLSAVATGTLTAPSLEELRELGKKLNTKKIPSDIKSRIIDIDTPSEVRRWAAFLGIEQEMDNTLLNSGIHAVYQGYHFSGSDDIPKSALKNLPTVFSEHFDKLSPESKLKALVANLSGRAYTLTQGTNKKWTPSLVRNKRDIPQYEDMENSFKKPIQAMIKNMSTGIVSKDSLEEFKRRIDLGITENTKKLKSPASAKAVIRSMMFNLFKMNQPVTKQSATYYFLNQVLEQNPANKEVVFQDVLDDLIKDRKAKSGTIEEKNKDIEKIKAYIQKTAKIFGVSNKLKVSSNAIRIDAKGTFVSKLPWSMARSKHSRGKLTQYEVHQETRGKYPAIDEAMKKIRLAHDTMPPFAAIALTKTFILASPIYSIVVSYATPDTARIVRTGELLKVASKDLSDQIQKYMQVKSIDIDPTKITSKDLV